MLAICVAASAAHVRSLLYYCGFDEVENSALVYAGVNRGTGDKF